MRINEQQARNIRSLGSALSQSELFEQIRRDNDQAIARHFAEMERSPGSGPDKALLDLMVTVALAEKSHRCLVHILPRIDQEDLHGPHLRRAIENNNLAAVDIITSFAPLSERSRHHAAQWAISFRRDPILETLLKDHPLQPGSEVDLYKEAVISKTDACLKVLLEMSHDPHSCREAMLVACERGRGNCIDLLLPHADVAFAIEAMATRCLKTPDMAADVAQHLFGLIDELCE